MAAIATDAAGSYAATLAIGGDAAGSYGATLAVAGDAAGTYAATLPVHVDAAGSYGADLPYVFWSYEPPGGVGSPGQGNTAECRVRLDVSTSNVNEGFALSVLDGASRYTVWLRADGLNIQEQAHVPVTLNDKFHRVRLAAKDGFCRVWVDDLLRQMGTAAGDTSKAAVTAGSFALDDW